MSWTHEQKWDLEADPSRVFRALTGELEPADRLALARYAEATRRDLREQIAVSFDDGEDRPTATD